MRHEGLIRHLFVILSITVLSIPLIPLPAHPAGNPSHTTDERITMNFEDTNIRIVIKFISELVHKNFLIDDKVKGKVTIISPEKITIPEAYHVFESILEVKGFTLIPAGQVIKIVPSNEAKQRGIETFTGEKSDLGERRDEFITRITRLRYVNADEVLTLIRPLFSRNGHLVAYKPTNTLIMTDLESNLYRIMKIINALDVKGYRAQLYVVPLNYASVQNVSEQLNKILEQTSIKTAVRPIRRGPRTPSLAQSGVAGVSSSIKIIPDERTNSLILLATRHDYENILKLVQKLDVKAPEGKGRVNIYYLQNAVAEEIVSVLNEFISGIKTGKKTAKGQVRLPTETEIKIVADKATNSLIINADPQDYEQIKSVIQKLDIPRSQVLIEALIMEVRGSDAVTLGVEWETFGGKIGTDNSVDRLGFGGSLPQGTLLPTIGSLNQGTIPASTTGFNLGVFGNFIEFNGQKFPSISALITAVASRSDTNVIATPQILTMDNEEAQIKVGENRPFLTQARTGEQGVNDVFQSFDFRDVGVTLKVTPHISQNRFVRLELFQEISNVDAQATKGTGATAPVTTKRSAETTVVVKDAHTIVIGGLIQDDVTDTTSKVPCLGDLPLIKHLFRSTSNSNTKTNLMIFLTPHIITNPLEAANLSNRKHNEFKSYKKYESKKPDLRFYGPALPAKPAKSEAPGKTPAAKPVPGVSGKEPVKTPERMEPNP